MITDETLLLYIEEVLSKLGDSPTHTKIADICFRLRALLKEQQKHGKLLMPAQRQRNEYMRNYMRKRRAMEKVRNRDRVPSQSEPEPN